MPCRVGIYDDGHDGDDDDDNNIDDKDKWDTRTKSTICTTCIRRTRSSCHDLSKLKILF